jgi:hypothetical protein
MSKHFEENNGTLDDTMYEQLNKAGLSKSVVDSYLEGVRQSTGFSPETAAPYLSEADVNEVKTLTGGEDGYNNLMDWAGKNLDREAAKDYDNVLATGNKSAVKFAVKALMGQYEDAVGRDSTLIQGKKSTPTETYRSMAEVVRAMNNPLYDTDESYRDDVRIKLERSNLKV